MNRIYLDNAATSYPKPPEVADAVYKYIRDNGANINRGGYAAAYESAEMVFETREILADMFGATDCKNVVFTKNVTESLNTVLRGFLKPGDHILCSSMEHNAVMRPLVQLRQSGIEFDRIPADSSGRMQTSVIESMIKPSTTAIAVTHASNVTGTVNPISEIVAIAHRHGIRLIVDAAQTAGVFPISMQDMHIDALCFTGHKSLMGPQGIGGFILDESMTDMITPIISGGTGSISHTEDIPSFMPDKFEAGTLNLPGIAGLNAGLKWINDKGMDKIRAHEMALTELFLEALRPMEASGKVKIFGLKSAAERSSVVSFQISGIDSAEAASVLDADHGIALRVGLHCAPHAHRTIGTYPSGTLRISFGAFNTVSDVVAAVRAIAALT